MSASGASCCHATSTIERPSSRLNNRTLESVSCTGTGTCATAVAAAIEQTQAIPNKHIPAETPKESRASLSLDVVHMLPVHTESPAPSGKRIPFSRKHSGLGRAMGLVLGVIGRSASRWPLRKSAQFWGWNDWGWGPEVLLIYHYSDRRRVAEGARRSRHRKHIRPRRGTSGCCGIYRE